MKPLQHQPPRRIALSRILKVASVILVVGLLMGAGTALVLRKEAALAEAPRFGVGPMPVRVVEARHGDLEISREYLATVEPLKVASLSSRVTAPIERIEVDEGDIVASGQSLVVMDRIDIRDAIAFINSKIAQAESEWEANESNVRALSHSLSYLTREAERLKTLRNRDAATVSEAENATDRMEQARGQLDAGRQTSHALKHRITTLHRQRDELKTRLGYCTIVSPFRGVVSRRDVDPGDLAMPGKSLLAVEDRRQFKLAFDVPQQDLPSVRLELPVRFRLPDGEQLATVSSLHPSLKDSRMLRVEVILDEQQVTGLATGAWLAVSVVTDAKKDVTIVPTAALIESPQQQPHVFVVHNGQLESQAVAVLGAGTGDTVAVHGVEPGQLVVINTFLGWSQLSAGRTIETMR
mgnify:FL=1